MDDNVVTRCKQPKGQGTIYAVRFDEATDGKFIEASRVLNSTPEAVFATVLSSFLESFETCLQQTLAAQRDNEIKH